MIAATNKTAVRRVAKFLAGLFLLPYCLMAATSSAAWAQVESTDYVAVLDFANESKVGNSMLARLATDAVVVELTNSNRFSVATRRQTQEAMEALDVQYPLNLTGVLRLAERLAVNSVVVGSLRQVQLTDKPRQARVELEVRMLDATTGEPMNGAIARGQSSPRETFTGDDDILITEAINNAAYVAVRTMVEYIIPQATVLNSVGDNEVLLNRGAQDGIGRGMEMIVTRMDEVIGKIRVVDVSNNDSRARIVTATQGVRPEDKARAIFKVSEIPAGGYGEPASRISGGVIGAGKKRGGAGKILGILGGLLILALVAGGHRSGGETVGPAVAAEAGAPPVLGTSTGGPGVRISLDPGRFNGGDGIQQLKIWRNGQVVMIASPGTPYVVDVELAAPVDVDYLNVDPADPTETVDATSTNVGIQAGLTYQYAASAIYRTIQSFGGEDGPTYRYSETPVQDVGRATPLNRILRTDMTEPALNASDVTMNNVSFTWRSVLGANQYIVEASLDPSFNDVGFRSAPLLWSPSSSGELVTMPGQNLQSQFSGATSSTTIYWRVGAVNTADRPGPVKDPGSGLRYIYGEVSQFRPNDAPPPPP